MGWRSRSIRSGPEGVAAEPPHGDRGHIVLDRWNDVTRTHSWERTSSYGTLDQDHEHGDLATFNRARHDRIGETPDGTHILIEVWLQGISEGARDQPTRILGAATLVPGGSLMDSPPPGGDVFPAPSQTLLEYAHDLRIGEDIDEKIEAVFEKLRLFADGYVRSQRDAVAALAK